MKDPGVTRPQDVDEEISSQLNRACEAFEQAWQANDPPDLVEHLNKAAPEGSALRQHLLRELVLIDLERRWQHKEPNDTVDYSQSTPSQEDKRLPHLATLRPKLEDYLTILPELGNADQIPVEMIVAEYRIRHDWGDQPGHDAYLTRFANQAADLRVQFEQITEGISEQGTFPSKHSLNPSEPVLQHRSLRVRCPHCHNPIELVDDATDALGEIDCPSCGSNFSLVDHGTNTTRSMPTVKQFGHFELIEELGVGGFGSVWKARDTELDRAVAIKIPRKEQLEREEIEQFLREARAAAQLKHPNIVSVHEVGRQDDTVYIVSDLVRGVPLDEWLTAQQLTCREAAELCAKLAEAVEHAHEAGVIHRDLKPGNILLDGEGQPHVLDFGLAKREVGEITMTVEGRVLGTPAYMSPEQARGEGHQADARTDIYSLGVILFQMLTGELPFRGTPRMLLHQVLNQEPRSPRSLNERIPRDLETITLKCLQKDPDRRYDTAHELSEDLQHFLAGEAIAARPIGKLERSWRWCRRNPLAAGLTAAVLLLCVTTSLVATIAAIRIDASRDAALEERRLAIEAKQREADERARAEKAESDALAAAEKAEAEARTAREVSAFLANMFEASAPFHVLGIFFGGTQQADATAELTAREILDRGARKVLTELADQPTVQADLLEAIGKVYLGLSSPDLAAPLLARSLEIRQQELPADHPDMATSLFWHGLERFLLGHYQESEGLLRRSLKIRQAVLGDGHPDVAQTKFALGVMLMTPQFGRAFLQADECKMLFQDVVDHIAAIQGEQSTDYAFALLALSGALAYGDDESEQLRLVLSAAEIFAANPATQQLGIGITQAMNAGVQHRLNNVDAAAELYKRSFATIREVLGPDHWAPVLLVPYVARSFERDNQLEEAEAILLDAELAFEGTGREWHPTRAALLARRASILVKQERTKELSAVIDKLRTGSEQGGREYFLGLGDVLKEQGHKFRKGDEDDAAVNAYREAAAAYAQADNLENSGWISVYAGIALRDLKRFDESAATIEEAIETRTKARGEEDGAIAWTIRELAYTLRDAGRIEDAATEFKRAIAIFRKNRDLEEAASTLYQLGKAYNTIGESRTAKRIYEGALNTVQEVGDMESLEGRAVVLESYGLFLREVLHDGETEERILRENLRVRRELYAPGEVNLEFLQSAMAHLAWTMRYRPEARDLGEAEELYREALSLAKTEDNDSLTTNRWTFDSIRNLVEMLTEQEKAQDAVAVLDEWLEIFRSSEDVSNELGDSLERVARQLAKLGQVDQAVNWYREQLEKFRKAGNKEAVARSWMGVGFVYRDQGNHSEALDFFRNAAKSYKRLGDDKGYGWALADVSGELRALGEYEEAISTLRQATEYRSNALGVTDFWTVWTVCRLIECLLDGERLEEAIETADKWMETCRKSEKRSRDLTKVSKRILSAIAEADDWDQAEDWYRGHIERYESVGNLAAAESAMTDLGSEARNRDDHEAAVACFLDAAQLYRRHDPDGDGHGWRLTHAGISLRHLGRYDQSEEVLREAIESRQQARGKDDDSIAWTIRKLAYTLRDAGKIEDAATEFNRAIAIYRQNEELGEAAWTLYELGKARSTDGDNDSAKRNYEKALDTYQEAGDVDSLERVAKELGKAGHLDQAEQWYQKQLEKFRQAGDAKAVSRVCMALGFGFREQGQHSDALKLFQEAASRYEELDDDDGLGRALAEVGMEFRSLGDNGDAIPALRQSVGYRCSALGATHYTTVWTVCRLIESLLESGRLDEAQQTLSEWREICKTSADRCKELAVTARQLAETLDSKDDWEHVERAHLQAIQLTGFAFGEVSSEVAKAQMDLGFAQRDHGEHEAALESFREAAKQYAHVGETSKYGWAIAHSGNALRALKRYEESESTLKRAVEIRTDALGREHGNIAWTIRQLGQTLAARGSHDDAEKAFEEARAIYERNDDDNSLFAQQDLALMLLDSEQYDRAIPAFRELLESRRTTLGLAHSSVAWTRKKLVDALKSAGRQNEVEPLLRDALELARSEFGETHEKVAEFTKSLADHLTEQGDFAGAESLLRDRITFFERLAETDDQESRKASVVPATSHNDSGHLLEDSQQVAWCYRKLGNVYLELDRLQEAIAATQKATSMFQERLKAKPDDARRIDELKWAATDLARHQFTIDPKSAHAAKPLEDAVRLVGELIEPLPDKADLESKHAWMLNDLADLLNEFGERDDAIEAVSQGILIFERLVSEKPDVVDFKIEMAGLICNRAVKLDPTDHEPRRAAFERAIGLLEEVLVQESGNRKGLQFLSINARNLQSELLALDNVAAHQKFCKSLGNYLAQAQETGTALRIADTCLAEPSSPVDPSLLITIVKRAVAEDDKSPYRCLLLGLAYYRAQRDNEALEALKIATELEVDSQYNLAIAEAYRALAFYRLGKTTVAKQARLEAVEIVGRLADEKDDSGNSKLTPSQKARWKPVQRELDAAFHISTES